MNFLQQSEKDVSQEYADKGYIIRPVADKNMLDKIRDELVSLIEKTIHPIINHGSNILNEVHKSLSPDNLNPFRLKMIEGINDRAWFRQAYYQLAMPYLNILVGNELSMQLRVNLSIQLPDDNSSLLPTHADTWSGDSPYEVVVWLPLVDCYDTKSMYLLPPTHTQELEKNFSKYAGKNSEELFQSIKNDIEWLKVNYGEVLVFNQTLPHGNRINKENETRWSMNCRFKSVFSPYGDKKLGEFFEPITLRTVSRMAMDYKLPSI